MRKRHVWIYHLLTPLVIAFLFIRFGYRFKKARNLPDKYIVLANHTTDFDPLFVAASFPRQMYFVASEHIARWKNAYKFIRYALAPILRYKGSVAVSTVREVLQRLRDGANICIFAEGARTWDGVTAPFLPSTGKLIKAAGCGLVTYKITGGYFVSPNWSEKSLRRGPISGAPVRVYSPKEIEKMTVDEINRAIAADLHEDAYARQMANPQPYKGKNLAHRMENLLFICPQCGEMDTIRSTGNHMECMKCHSAFRYTEYGMLEGMPFQTVKELAAWEKNQVEQDTLLDIPYTAAQATLITVDNHVETQVAKGPLLMNREGLFCGDWHMPLANISELAMHGRHALVFTAKDVYYELIPQSENALKFHWLYEAHKNNAAQAAERSA